jgi:hypothetical protein
MDSVKVWQIIVVKGVESALIAGVVVTLAAYWVSAKTVAALGSAKAK